MADGFTLEFDFAAVPEFNERQKAMMVDAAAATMAQMERELKDDVRAAMSAAVPGRRRPSRLGLGWRVLLHPKSGRSYTPVVEVRPDGKMTGRTWGALSAFAQGARIRSKSGGFVIVPTDFAMRLSYRRNQMGRTESPERWAMRTGRKLRLVVPRKKGFLLLVVDPPKGKRGIRGAAKPEVAFVLLRETGVAKRFNLKRVVAPYATAIGDEFVRRHKALQQQEEMGAYGVASGRLPEGVF